MVEMAHLLAVCQSQVACCFGARFGTIYNRQRCRGGGFCTAIQDTICGSLNECIQ